MRLVTYVCAFLLFPAAAFTQQPSKVPTVEAEIVAVPSGYIAVQPAAINNRGQVVGTLQRGAPTFGSDAFLWSQETGFVIIAADAYPTDINARGDVTLGRFDCSGEGRCGYVGSVWNQGTVVAELGNLFPTAINNRGDVAGLCKDGAFQEFFTACAIRHGVFEEWGCPDSDDHDCGQFAWGINERGDVVGGRVPIEDAGGRATALYFPRTGGEVVLGPGRALDINNRGTVVGSIETYEPSFFEFAASWTKAAREGTSATRYSIGPQGSRAVAVNARGWTIGLELDRSGGRPVLWTSATAAAVDLTMDDYANTAFFDLNDRGQIVGMAGDWLAFSQPQPMVIWTVKP
jgi:hypothetical protein